MNKENKISRAEHSEQIKRKIHDCALSLFNQKGYDQTTIKDISHAANVSVGSIYHFFKGKSDIVNYPFQQMDNYYKQLYTRLRAEGPDRPAIEILLDYYIQAQTHSLTYGRFTVGLTYIGCIRYPEKGSMLTVENRVYQQIQRELIISCQAEGSIDGRWEVENISRQALLIARGLYICWLVEADEFDMESESHQAFSMFLATLSPHFS